MNKLITQLAAAAVLQLWLGTAGHAQSLTPMRGEVKSFAPEFLIRVVVGNPYNRPVNFDVRAYDEKFNPIDGFVIPSVVRLAANDSRQVTVRLPFLDAPQRKVRVCAEGLFGVDKKSSVRTQVCGRFLARHFGS